MVKGTPKNEIPERLIRDVCERLVANQPVRRTLPLWGRLHVDRQLPFLAMYRRPVVGVDEGTYKLVTSEASYLFAPGIRSYQDSLLSLIGSVALTLSEVFGGFLLLEVSTGVFDSGGSAADASRPGFRVTLPKAESLDVFEDTVVQMLAKVRVRKRVPYIEVNRRDRIGPRALPRLMTTTAANAHGVTLMGLEVKPIHLDGRKGDFYPLVLGELEHELTKALRQIFFQFARSHTTHRPRHYHGLGRRAFVKAAWAVDQQLAQVSSGFDFLLQVTPANPVGAWKQFQRSKYSKQPVFRYRPLAVDPVELKRQLYGIPVQRLEDPVLRELFREKQMELDRRLTMLLDLNTPKFMYGSLQLYGDIDDKLVGVAKDIIAKLPRRSKMTREKKLSPTEIAECGEQEIEYYKNLSDKFKATVQIRDDITGLMVSRGALLVSRQSRITPSRLTALLQHEVGTHLVTYYNGRAQPFRQLASGLAGYESLQEGLAVFAEYLVGGLTVPRLRLLACRVLAVRQMIDRAPFAVVYQTLVEDHGLEKRTAFNLTFRVFRGGGLTKDAVYLQGLIGLLKYLHDGGSVEPLIIGKFAANHVPIIEELRWREVLRPAPLRPRYLDNADAQRRLAAARNGIDLVELTGGTT